MEEILNRKLLSPTDLANAKIGLSLVTQWNKRKTGELKFLRVGKKIFYTTEHLEKFFAACEIEVENENLSDAV